MRNKPPPQEKNKYIKTVWQCDLIRLTSSNPNSEIYGAEENTMTTQNIILCNNLFILVSKDHINMLRIV